MRIRSAPSAHSALRLVLTFSVAILSFACTLPAQAQTFDDRLDQVRRSQQAEERKAQAEAQRQAAAHKINIPLQMRVIINQVQLEEIPAERAFQWWSLVTGIPTVINWQAMEQAGVDPQTILNIDMQAIPARHLLELLINQTSQDVELLYEVTPWYIHILTKEEANRNTIVRIYDINDLLMVIPDFAGPSFDLEQALENSGGGGRSGGRSGGGGGQLFTNDNQNRDAQEVTKEERGQQIAQLIRDTIEPTIWQAHGGEFSSIRYFNGRLIIRAPKYVHNQIGTPLSTPGNSPGSTHAPRNPPSTPAQPQPVRSLQDNTPSGTTPPSISPSGISPN